jgi:antitoxin component HigA of HigAB toxin-antitoxin module
MLTRKSGSIEQPQVPFYHKSISLKVAIYRFPKVEGLEDVSIRMATVTAETLFSALLKGYDLSPITNEEQAKRAERFLEYLLRAFEEPSLPQVKAYLHLLEMLITEYDEQHTVAAVKNLPPHKLLKTLLEEAGLEQKALVPDCFKSASQVSEFLSQKRGRQKLTADVAVKLGARFHLNPLLFLECTVKV